MNCSFHIPILGFRRRQTSKSPHQADFVSTASSFEQWQKEGNLYENWTNFIDEYAVNTPLDYLNVAASPKDA
jgi:hypothetical protein